MDRELAAELARMAAAEERMREPALGKEGQFGDRLSVEQRLELARVDLSNTDRLCEIVRTHGWPGVSLVGEQDGARDRLGTGAARVAGNGTHRRAHRGQ